MSPLEDEFCLYYTPKLLNKRKEQPVSASGEKWAGNSIIFAFLSFICVNSTEHSFKKAIINNLRKENANRIRACDEIT